MDTLTTDKAIDLLCEAGLNDTQRIKLLTIAFNMLVKRPQYSGVYYNPQPVRYYPLTPTDLQELEDILKKHYRH